MSGDHHKAGEVWRLDNTANWWIQNLKCKGCDKGFEKGQWVIQATTTPRREFNNRQNGYARIRHIQCLVDAQGHQIGEIPVDKT